MKNRFNSYDIVCNVSELQKLIGLRVNQIYDIDNRTYLIRFQGHEEKCVLLLESGQRFHTTAFEWPKNVAPSGFSLKLRKHLKNKRLERFRQLGADRIVDLEFGSGPACHHVILELYDRGNIMLTDFEMTILNILRPHTEGEVTRFAVREKYPESRANEKTGTPNANAMLELLKTCKPGENLRRALNLFLAYGSALIDHVLLKNNLYDCKLLGKLSSLDEVDKNKDTDVGEEEKVQEQENKKKEKRKKNHIQNDASLMDKRIFNYETDIDVLMKALNEAEEMMNIAKQTKSKGYIIFKRELKPQIKQQQDQNNEEYFDHSIEYHPYLFEQFKNQPYKEFASFDAAVDEFYSTLEGQKIDMKNLQQERDAYKKLSNVKRDHEIRLENLNKVQLLDKQKAELITRNQLLVDNAILAIRTALAQQMSWPDINDLVKMAQTNGDEVAMCIKQLKLEINHFSLYLKDPYDIDANSDDDNDNNNENITADDDNNEKLKPMIIDINLGLSAYANATHYYDQKRSAAKKEYRTIESSTKALKSAERKTELALQEMKTITNITKARKIYWFEKFHWFISTENYLVIGGHDSHQNELIVKRYMRPSDIYVHAEIQGATSVIIRNPNVGVEIPPKTLLEAGAMAISYSVAWDAKVVTSAYWVHSEQVSKTAPTGEFLTTGSFMIRGKKNFLPPCHLVMGLSFLFKLEDSFVERHAGERRQRNFDDDTSVVPSSPQQATSITIENEKLETVVEDKEIELIGSDDDEDDDADEVIKNKELAEEKNEEDKVNEEEEDKVNEEEEDKVNEEEEDKVNEEEDKVNEEEEKDDIEFPDTQVRIEHDTGKVTLHKDPMVERIKKESEQQEYVIYLGDDKPIIIVDKGANKDGKLKMNRSRQNSDGRSTVIYNKAIVQNKEIPDEQQKSSVKQQLLKRGQRSKLKKIKEKYKDQDEEEKQIRMAILKSDGKSNENTMNTANKKNKKALNSDGKKKSSKNIQQLKQKQRLLVITNQYDESSIEPTTTTAIEDKTAETNMLTNETTNLLTGTTEDVDDEDNDDNPADIDVCVLDSLTGCPIDDDELLFAVPVVAPYQVLQNYKYKVKLTPGGGRRGKIVKIAMLMFSKNRTCTPREKDLFKGVKYEVIARNIPGKCKLSAPQSLMKIQK